MSNFHLILKLSIALCITIQLLSCKEPSPIREEAKKLLKGQLPIPQKLKTQFAARCKTFGQIPSPDEVKILTVVNGNCYSCVQNLEKWSKIMKEDEFSPQKVRYYFLIESEDNFFSFKNQYEHKVDSLLNYPVIIDKNASYFSQMNISYNASLQTFLLDSSDNIILVGNPLYSEELMELYRKKLKAFQA